MTLIQIAKTGDLASGQMKMVLADGKEILLARAGDKFYAVDHRCSHMGGKLSRGKLEGTVVTCPLHGSRFDIADGHIVRWLSGSGLISAIGRKFKSPQSLHTYHLQIDGDVISVVT